MNFIDCSDTVCGKAQNDSMHTAGTDLPTIPVRERHEAQVADQDILLGVAIDMWTGDIGARIGITLGLMRRG